MKRYDQVIVLDKNGNIRTVNSRTRIYTIESVKESEGVKLFNVKKIHFSKDGNILYGLRSNRNWKEGDTLYYACALRNKELYCAELEINGEEVYF